jgi:hypothetical protein
MATLLPALIGLHRAPLDIKNHLPRSSRANR